LLVEESDSKQSPDKFDILNSPDRRLITQSTSYSALKVINKNALHPDEVKVIRGEAKILEMLVDEPNVVQIRNVSLNCLTCKI
jgi:hypothetical protein